MCNSQFCSGFGQLLHLIQGKLRPCHTVQSRITREDFTVMRNILEKNHRPQNTGIAAKTVMMRLSSVTASRSADRVRTRIGFCLAHPRTIDASVPLRSHHWYQELGRTLRAGQKEGDSASFPSIAEDATIATGNLNRKRQSLKEVRSSPPLTE